MTRIDNSVMKDMSDGEFDAICDKFKAIIEEHRDGPTIGLPFVPALIGADYQPNEVASVLAKMTASFIMLMYHTAGLSPSVSVQKFAQGIAEEVAQMLISEQEGGNTTH